MKVKDYFNRKKRLQNFKKCVGCSEIFELDTHISKCPTCNGKNFIPVTEYIFIPR